MGRYSLVLYNKKTGKTNILLEKQDLIKIDKAIYSQFTSEEEVKSHYNILEDEELKIMYKYAGEFKYLKLVYRNDYNREFGQVLMNITGNKIDINSQSFISYICKFMSELEYKELEYLYSNRYINQKVYEDFIDYDKNSDDRKEIFYSIKKNLQIYTQLRKLHMGLYKCRNEEKKPIEMPDVKKKISTNEDLLDNLYNNGKDLDDVYNTYDIDDLAKLDEDNQLGIDGLPGKHK